MKRVTIAVCDECGFEKSKDNFCENCNKEIQWSTFIEEEEYKQAAQDLARITAERDEYKRQAKLYNDDMMFVRAQRDELRIIAKKLVNCFVVDVECDWWKPNPLTPMSERDIALTELAAALKQSS